MRPKLRRVMARDSRAMASSWEGDLGSRRAAKRSINGDLRLGRASSEGMKPVWRSGMMGAGLRRGAGKGSVAIVEQVVQFPRGFRRGLEGAGEGFRDAKLHAVGEAAAFAGALDGLVGKGFPTGGDEAMIVETVVCHDFVQRLRPKVAFVLVLSHAALPLPKPITDQARSCAFFSPLPAIKTLQANIMPY